MHMYPYMYPYMYPLDYQKGPLKNIQGIYETVKFNGYELNFHQVYKRVYIKETVI